MLGMRLNYELGMKELAIERTLKRALKTFPPHIWDNVEAEVIAMSSQRASEIQSHKVSKMTHRLRLWRKKQGIGVPTYVGQTEVPVGGWKVGRRTGTFLHDYSRGTSPGVEVTIGNEQRVQNGSFNYEIVVDAFENQYPYIFEDYLKDRGIVPEGGLLDFGEEQENHFIDMLEKVVYSEISKKFGN